jgi:hypothetical protein
MGEVSPFPHLRFVRNVHQPLDDLRLFVSEVIRFADVAPEMGQLGIL